MNANCINLIANAYFSRVKMNIAYISILRSGVSGLGGKVVPVCRPRLRSVIFHGCGIKHLEFAASLGRYLSSMRVIFVTMNAPPSRGNSTSLGCILRITHAVNHCVGGCLLVMAGDAIPLNATRGIGSIVHGRLAGQGMLFSFSITSGPRFLGRKSTVTSFVGPSHIMININSSGTERVVRHLCGPL